MTNIDPATNLERLRELTKIVVPFSQISDVHKNKVDYTVYQGDCHGIGLYNDGNVAVQLATMEPGTVLKSHVHDEIEVITAYEGGMTVVFSDHEVKVNKGDTLIVRPGESHVVRSMEGCKMIAVTVPAAKGYPDGK